MKGGDGPTVLVVAGNHGDEVEGLIAAGELARELQPDEVGGQVIILPAANRPAVEAGLRTSPLDGGNLNRAFPGKPDGTPTELLAHAIEHLLLPRCDAVLDLHSGGSSLLYEPCAILGASEDPDVAARQLAAARAFGAPLILRFARLPGFERSLGGAAARRGIPNLATELGGGGGTNPERAALARAGIRRVLAHWGLLEPGGEGEPGSEVLDVGGPEAFLHAPGPGLFEPAVTLGQRVGEGEVLGWLHAPFDVDRPPRTFVANAAGRVVCLRRAARSEAGDCLLHTARQGTAVDFQAETFSL